MKWEIMSRNPYPLNELNKLLEEGWEPFAVTVEANSATAVYNSKYVIWLRREVA